MDGVRILGSDTEGICLEPGDFGWCSDTQPTEVGIEVEIEADGPEIELDSEEQDENIAPSTAGKKEEDSPESKEETMNMLSSPKKVRFQGMNDGNTGRKDEEDAGGMTKILPIRKRSASDAVESTSSHKMSKTEPSSATTATSLEASDLTPSSELVEMSCHKFQLRRVVPLEGDKDDGLNVIDLGDDKKRFVIGRLMSNDIVFKDVKVSRRHAVLEMNDADEWILTNLSANGVKVDRNILGVNAKTNVKLGDVVTFYDDFSSRYKLEKIPVRVGSSPERSRLDDLETQAMDFQNATADVKRQHRKELERLKVSQHSEQVSVLAELEANKEARKKLEQEMGELGSKLEAKEKTLAEKQEEEEALRKKIADFAEKEAKLAELLKAREKDYSEQVLRIQRDSESLMAELESEFKKALSEREAEIEKQREAIQQQVAAAKLEKTAASNKVAQYEAALKQEQKRTQALIREAADNREELLKDVGDIFTSELECPICQEILVKAVTLNCSHSFCTECLHQWSTASARSRSDKGTCPSCRIKITSVNASRAIDSLVESMIKKMGPAKIEERRQLEAHHESIRVAREAPVSRQSRGGASGNSRSARNNRSRFDPVVLPVTVPSLSNPLNSPSVSAPSTSQTSAAASRAWTVSSDPRLPNSVSRPIFSAALSGGVWMAMRVPGPNNGAGARVQVPARIVQPGSGASSNANRPAVSQAQHTPQTLNFVRVVRPVVPAPNQEQRPSAQRVITLNGGQAANAGRGGAPSRVRNACPPVYNLDF